MATKTTKNQEMVIYQAANGAIELKGDTTKETIWASQSQIAEIFGIDRTVISKHIKNIFKDNELDQKVVCAKFAHTTKHGALGNREQTRELEYYNLYIILAVGYRTKSTIAIKFRQWATQTLKKHIVDGWTINPSRIERNHKLFLEAIEDVKKLSSSHDIPTDSILELIKVFGNTWFSLDAYDKDTLETKNVTQTSIKLDADELYTDILKLKDDLLSKNEATEIFAQERAANSLEGIFGAVFQSAFGEEAYPGIEAKAANLLYFIVKNHPFIDGNKRSGAFAFIWFLQKTGVKFRHKITPEALTAITLLIATSDPKDKENMVGLVGMLLSGQ